MSVSDRPILAGTFISRERYLTEGEPIDLGQKAGLLLDDTLVEDRWNVERRMNDPSKHARNPIVVADQPWEENAVYHPSVLYDPEHRLFRMWYTIWTDAAYWNAVHLDTWDRR